MPRSKAAAIQARASTASQPTKNTATPASARLTTRSRRRAGTGAATGRYAGSLGVTRSVRSVTITCAAGSIRSETSSAWSTSMTRAVGEPLRVG